MSMIWSSRLNGGFTPRLFGGNICISGKVQSQTKSCQMFLWSQIWKISSFMMSERGMEANPEKLEAIARLAEPRCIKEIQQLNGCIAPLR